MKSFLFFIPVVLFSIAASAQVNEADTTGTKALSLITKTDGTEYIGTILSDDGREVLIHTKSIGKIFISKSDIRKIVQIEDGELIAGGEYQPTGPFTTRYAFTTNALPIEKGENYTMINLYGPEVHFAVTDNLSLGVMSTWIGSPLVLAMKYSFKTQESGLNFSVGTLFGTTSYINSFKGYGGLHWASMTLGDRRNNFTFSGGYIYLGSTGTRMVPEPGVYNQYPYSNSIGPIPVTHGPVFSVAGIAKVGAKASFVFDSMLGVLNTERINIEGQIPNNSQGTYSYTVTKTNVVTPALFLMPGMRFQRTDRKAFQISLAGVSFFDERNTTSFPLPMLSWLNKF